MKTPEFDQFVEEWRVRFDGLTPVVRGYFAANILLQTLDTTDPRRNEMVTAQLSRLRTIRGVPALHREFNDYIDFVTSITPRTIAMIKGEQDGT